ncbi:MAG TPA: tetratricopeptide repeat protein [Methanoregulaceae archaeon]|nr:tetratricopeptide repeat protein [Methanoregulaceae archaeon]HPD76453.1 tetratricopeptide repeat protein [Methanoregulaceae archaeon]HRY75063.1 tetratricopeptide repeat protein [Methanoregulaceae archaeon]
MESRPIIFALLAGLMLLCTIPAVQADESTNLTNQAILLIHNGSNNYPRAIALIDEALRINSSEFGGRSYALELKTYCQIQMGNYTEALTTIDQALALEESAVLWNNKGYVLYRQGNYPGSVEAYTRALKIDPTYTVALINKGNSFMELKKYDDAVTAYTSAFAADAEAHALSVPQQVKTYNNLGDAYFQLGKYSESAAAYQNALTAEPGNTTATAGFAKASQQAQAGSLLLIAGIVVLLLICGGGAYYFLKVKKAEPEKRPSKSSKKNKK